MPSPDKARRLAARAAQHQNNAMAKIAVGRVGNQSHMHKLAVTNPELHHAARRMASAMPARMPTHEEYNDAVNSAHKAMKNATAFHKASKGLGQPMGKRARKAMR